VLKKKTKVGIDNQMMKDFFLFSLIIIVSLSLRIALGEAKKHRELVYNASVLSMKEFIQNRIDQTENSPDIEQILQSLVCYSNYFVSTAKSVWKY
jgi:hypothetical protein